METVRTIEEDNVSELRCHTLRRKDARAVRRRLVVANLYVDIRCVDRGGRELVEHAKSSVVISSGCYGGRIADIRQQR